MVQPWYGGWNIPYIPNLHGNHTLCYFRNDCRILKQKNPSEGNDVSSSKKREQQICQQPQQMSFFVKRLESQGNNFVENIRQMYDKNSWGFCQRSSHTKTWSAHDQHILLKVQDTDLAAWEAHYHATCQRDYTREDTDTRKPSKTLKPLKSKLPTRPYKNYFQYIVQYVMGRIV